MKNVIFLIVVLFSINTIGQKGVGYFGKRNFIGISVSPSITPYVFMRPTSTDGKFKFGPTVLNFKFSAFYDFAIARKQTLGLKYTYDPARVTLHGIELNPNSNDPDIEYIMGDPIFHVHSIQLNHRYYVNENIVGVGFHITSYVGMHMASAGKVEYTSQLRTIYDELETRVPYGKDKGIHYYLKKGDLDPKNENGEEFKSNAFLFGLQLGWDFPISNFAIATVALGSSGFIGFNKYNGKIGPGYDIQGFWTDRDRSTQSENRYTNYEYRLRQSFRLKSAMTFEFGFKFLL